MINAGCVSRPWDFSSSSSFFLPQNQSLGEVLRSQIEEHLKKKVVHLYRSRRFFSWVSLCFLVPSWNRLLVIELEAHRAACTLHGGNRNCINCQP